MKKKVVRRKTSVAEEITSEAIKENEKRTINEASVTPKIYQNNGFDRLNAIPDYTEKVKENRLETVIANFFGMSQGMIKEAVKDKSLTMLEFNVLQLMQWSMDTEKRKEAITISRYLHDRVAGRPKERVEFSGVNGQPLEIKTKYVPDFESMSKEQRNEFILLMDKLSSAPLKQIEEDDEV